MSVHPAASQSPPRARLAFRVGIVGHRPNRLPLDKPTLDQLQRMIGRVIESVQSKVAAFAAADRDSAQPLYAPDAPVLRAISPLAEGTDRMFAEEAIRLGFELLCPMPFHQEEFEKDFLPPNALIENSRDQFRDLLQRAGERAGLIKYELDGQRSASGDAYGMAGRVVLNQSDLLIVVWDRGLPKGGGGTVQTLHEAVEYHVPVLWIDATVPQEWRLLLTEDDISRVINRQPAPGIDLHAETMDAQIERIVLAELGSARVLAGQNQVTQLTAPEYFAETRPKRNFWFVWKMFRDLVGQGRLSRPKIAIADFETQVSGDWPIETDIKPADPRTAALPNQPAPTPPQMEHWVNRRLRPHYAWADKLADWYADHYRSAYIAIYILSALGVLISLWGHTAWWSPALEAICVGTIVALVLYGSRRHWHERWMEYRLLAELIRQIRIKIPLGGGRPLPRTLIPGVYEDLSETWMYWHMRAIARAIGVPAAKVDRQYLLSCLGYVERLVDGQLSFHQTTMKRSERIAETLHSLASNLFVISLCFIGVRLVTLATRNYSSDEAARYLPLPLTLLILAGAIMWRSGPIFLLLATFLAVLVAALSVFPFPAMNDLFLVLGVLPAFGAAFTGIANQGEFVRLQKRSIAMASAFTQFKTRLAQLRSRIETEPNTTSMMSNVINLATEITQAMVDEVSDWRVVVAEQPMRW